MRILIIHNQLWAHYKAIIFNELQKIVDTNDATELLVLQLAMVEKSRTALGQVDLSTHRYNYQLVHDGTLEEISLKERLIAMLKAVRKFKPDVVNLTGYYDIASWIILFYCKLLGIKTILSNESTLGDHIRGGIKEKFKSFIICQFDGYFNFGTRSAEYLITLGAKPEQLLVQRNCVDNKRLKELFDNAKRLVISKEQKSFIFIGRLIPFKNLPSFMEALEEVNAQVANPWGLIILGEGEQKTELQQRSTGLSYPVTFINGVSWEEIPTYLAQADALVLPSYSEPWGLVVNEAMACGMPVLVSEKCGCAIDLVKEGINGFTFNPTNREDIKRALLEIMNQNLDLNNLGQQSINIIKDYSSENVAKEMFEGYTKICQLGKK
jgi:glycosyltransferase involved in cell wall biosynthesis